MSDLPPDESVVPPETTPPAPETQIGILGETGPLERVAPNTDAPPPPNPDELMVEANRMGTEMRKFIVRCKKLPRTPGLGPHQDEVRALALAQAHLQTGWLWLRRAIKPEDVF